MTLRTFHSIGLNLSERKEWPGIKWPWKFYDQNSFAFIFLNSCSNSLNGLPNEILLKIFGYLPFDSISNMRQISYRFNEIADQLKQTIDAKNRYLSENYLNFFSLKLFFSEIQKGFTEVQKRYQEFVQTSGPVLHLRSIMYPSRPYSTEEEFTRFQIDLDDCTANFRFCYFAEQFFQMIDRIRLCSCLF